MYNEMKSTNLFFIFLICFFLVLPLLHLPSFFFYRRSLVPKGQDFFFFNEFSAFYFGLHWRTLPFLMWKVGHVAMSLPFILVCIDRHYHFPCEKLDVATSLPFILVCNFFKTLFFLIWMARTTEYKPINSHPLVISYILFLLLLLYYQCNCRFKNA